MLVSLNIVGSANINGAEIVGSNMVYNYEQVIRQVTYTNQKPAYYLNRQFKLACSQLNKRFVSNEFIETVRYRSWSVYQIKAVLINVKCKT